LPDPAPTCKILPVPDHDTATDDQWDAWHESIVDHVRTHPPRSLRDLAPTLADADAGVWNDRVSWRLACRCGGESLRVLGYPLEDYNPRVEPGLFACPIAVECAACNAQHDIFDSRHHGYNAECQRHDDSGPNQFAGIRGEGPRAVVSCPSCKHKAFIATAECLHSHFDLLEDEPHLNPYAQDFFDSFNLSVTCASCGHESTPVEYETA